MGFDNVTEPEILNAVWKHQVLLKQIKDSRIIIDALFDLISAGHIQLVALKEKTARSAYSLAVKTKTPIYDVAFIALALDLGVKLRTFDRRQAAIYKNQYRS